MIETMLQITEASLGSPSKMLDNRGRHKIFAATIKRFTPTANRKAAKKLLRPGVKYKATRITEFAVAARRRPVNQKDRAASFKAGHRSDLSLINLILPAAQSTSTTAPLSPA